MKSTCLWYALDRVTEAGGKLCLVRSQHWCIPHVQHHSLDDVLTQFVPPSDLKTPLRSLFGFEGVIEVGDRHAHERGPIHPVCMFVGTCILFVSGALWFMARPFRARATA